MVALAVMSDIYIYIFVQCIYIYICINMYFEDPRAGSAISSSCNFATSLRAVFQVVK